jgi:hypothetical protein
MGEYIMIFVKVDDLKSGMRLGKPIYNKNGVLLYERDTHLTTQAIYGIKNFGLMGLYILEPAEPVPPMTEDDIHFERFQTMSVFSIREDLDLIASGKKDKGLDWLCSLVIKNYGGLNRKINFVQSLRSSEDFVYKHVLNVAILVALIGGQMQLSLGRINALVKAAVLHDIGVLKFQETPDGENVPLEVRRIIRDNTKEILDKYMDLDIDIAKLVYQMQDLYCIADGDPIPAAIKANSNVNILFVADAYDRMTAMKSEEEPTSEVLAIRKLLDNPEKYDPKVVNSLIAAINILTPGVCIELNNGQTGLVIRENKDNIFEPLVLNFRNNQLFDLSLDSVKETLWITDVMKTMDNRIKLDHSLLEEFGPASI